MCNWRLKKENMETNQQNDQEIHTEPEGHRREQESFYRVERIRVKGEATVTFGVGSSNISAPHQEQLKTLAENALNLRGYIIEVTGYADSTGSAAVNTKLSEDRAKAVITYLIQQGNVPTRHIVAPGAMGEYGAVAPNESSVGRARTVGLRLRSWSTRASPVVKDHSCDASGARFESHRHCKGSRNTFCLLGLSRGTH